MSVCVCLKVHIGGRVYWVCVYVCVRVCVCVYEYLCDCIYVIMKVFGCVCTCMHVKQEVKYKKIFVQVSRNVFLNLIYHIHSKNLSDVSN